MILFSFFQTKVHHYKPSPSVKLTKHICWGWLAWWFFLSIMDYVLRRIPFHNKILFTMNVFQKWVFLDYVSITDETMIMIQSFSARWVSTFVLQRVFPCRLFFSKCFFDIIKNNRTLANSKVPRHLILSSQDRYCLSLQSIRYILSIYIQKYSTKRIRLETNQKSDVRIINLVFFTRSDS
jgi:hypothetical protein